MKRILTVALAFLMLSSFALNAARAEEGKKTGCLQSVELLSGFGLANLKDQEDYHIIPFFLGLGFDLKPLLKKAGINYPGLLQFILEPFASYVDTPNKNAEVGNNFAFKFGLAPDTWKFQPYLKGGVGVIYLTQHFRYQATQFNFTEFLGLGTHYFLKKNFALTLEYRYRHISNADIKTPNRGIETHIGLFGASYFF